MEKPTNEITHVIPLGKGEKHKVSVKCDCKPFISTGNGRDICVHNSYDNREVNERRRVYDKGKPWCLAYERAS